MKVLSMPNFLAIKPKRNAFASAIVLPLYFFISASVMPSRSNIGLLSIYFHNSDLFAVFPIVSFMPFSPRIAFIKYSHGDLAVPSGL